MVSKSGLIASGIMPSLSPVGLQLAMEKSGWYPAEFFLTPPSVIVDQQDIPCCVSCAIATCVEILNPGCEQLSPLFHYFMFNSTQYRGQPESFGGMTLGDGLNVLSEYGICIHRYYSVSFTKQGVQTPPDETAIADALARRMPFDNNREVGSYVSLSDNDRVNEWKKALLGNRPILIGFFETDQYDSGMSHLQGNLNPDKPHAVAVLGYCESECSFLVQDSQGGRFNFKNKSQWWLPYNMVESVVVEQAYVIGYPPVS